MLNRSIVGGVIYRWPLMNCLTSGLMKECITVPQAAFPWLSIWVQKWPNGYWMPMMQKQSLIICLHQTFRFILEIHHCWHGCLEVYSMDWIIWISQRRNNIEWSVFYISVVLIYKITVASRHYHTRFCGNASGFFNNSIWKPPKARFVFSGSPLGDRVRLLTLTIKRNWGPLLVR